jgi:aryl-alcohol dehydrogenase-like predicted oxidoreductase
MISDSELDRVIFGCGNFGGMGSAPDLRHAGDSPETAMILLDAARAAGLTRFDTANTYGGGVSETVLGHWLAQQGSAFRTTAQVATKVGNPNGCPPGDRPLSRSQVAHHLDQSLQRLGLERIGLYYVHEFDASTPLDETLEAISRAAQSGKIDQFGVSNATAADLDAVLSTADSSLLQRFSHVQNEFNRLNTGDRDTLLPLIQRQGLQYVAFSPLAGGLLTGKYQRDTPAAAETRIGAAAEHYAHYMTPDAFAEIDALTAEAERTGTSTAGAALRFVLDTPGVASLLIAPRKIEHFASYGLSSRP